MSPTRAAVSAAPHHHSSALPVAIFAATLTGAAAGAAMFWWQGSTEVAVSTFIISAYSVGLWTYVRFAHPWSADLRRSLERLAINRFTSRVYRLITAVTFWLSLASGIGIIGSAVWYAGLRTPLALAWVETGWVIVTILLNYDLTLLYPTTRCRSCGYQLIGQLDSRDPLQVVTCPECGISWSKKDLALGMAA